MKRSVISKKNVNIEHVAYGLYQLDWMMRYGYDIDDFVLNLQSAWDAAHADEGIYAADMPFQLYEEKLMDRFSFNESWVDFQTFLDNEYKDKDYMLKLFSVLKDSKDVVEIYNGTMANNREDIG